MEIWSLILLLVRLLLYVAMMLVQGGLLYAVLFGKQMSEASRVHVVGLVRVGVLIGLGATCLRVPAAAANLGGDFASAFDPVFLGLMMETSLGLSSGLGVAGFLLAAVLVRVAGGLDVLLLAVLLLAILLLAGTSAIHGHATSGGVITGVLVMVHLSCVAIWLGAFLPLHRLCRLAHDDPAAHTELGVIARRFAQVGGMAVLLLLVSGGGMAAYLTGSISALFTTGYGQALLVKLSVVVGLLGLAALNRFRLVPAISAGGTRAVAQLGWSIRLEMAGALVILAVTSLLTTSLALPMPL